MKRKIIAWTAAILIAALVSVAFLVPADPNPDFGMVEELYHLNGVVEPITDCGGDTDVFCAETIESNYMNLHYPSVRFSGEDGKSYAFTSDHYVDGELVEEHEEASYIEKLVDGEWVWYDRMWEIAARQQPGGIPPYLSTSVGYTMSFNFPYNDPGTYRMTHYFRESVSELSYHYTTGDELYSISHTYTVPEPSDKRFDLLSVAAYTYYDSADTHIPHIYMLIRVNEGERIYLDRACGRIEKLVDGNWVDITRPEYLDDDDSRRRYHGHYREGDGSDVFETWFDYFVIDDLSADYRITLEFVENEDGSGERYTLQFRMNFSEEG